MAYQSAQHCYWNTFLETRELSKGWHLSGSRNETHLDLLDLVLFLFLSYSDVRKRILNPKFSKQKKIQLNLWVNSITPTWILPRTVGLHHQTHGAFTWIHQRIKPQKQISHIVHIISYTYLLYLKGHDSFHFSHENTWKHYMFQAKESTKIHPKKS